MMKIFQLEKEKDVMITVYWKMTYLPKVVSRVDKKNWGPYVFNYLLRKETLAFAICRFQQHQPKEIISDDLSHTAGQTQGKVTKDLHQMVPC